MIFYRKILVFILFYCMNTISQSVLRTFFLEQRTAMPVLQQQKESAIICAHLQKIFSEKNPKTIAFFAPTPYEPDISSLFFSNTYMTCFPKVYADGTMKMKYAAQKEDLEYGKFQIREPKEEMKDVSPGDIDIILVPAVAIDIQNNRIGMGKGFYDRYLSECSHALKIGVVFSSQCSASLFPVQSWDIAMNILCTAHM